jgi:predicted Zn-dependent protease
MGANMGYAQDYQNAQRAYIEGNYADAAPIIDRLAENYPHDPSVCLLRAHIYCGLRQYAIAHEQYQAPLRQQTLAPTLLRQMICQMICQMIYRTRWLTKTSSILRSLIPSAQRIMGPLLP